MTKRVNVPRVSIAVTILDDPDFIGLCQTSQGREAFALFTALVAAAKVQDNGGKFTEADVVLAYMVRWPHDAFSAALEALTASQGQWIKRTTKGIEIRSFQKWNNGWGGPRTGAGRPPKKNQDVNQDANQDLSSKNLGSMPVSVSVTASVSDTEKGSACEAHAYGDPPKAADTPRADRFAAFWLVVHAKVGKEAARKAYPKAVKRIREERPSVDPHDFLIERMKAFAATPSAYPADRSPIHPATWLNGGRYDDDPEEWQRDRSGATRNGHPSTTGGTGSDARRADKAGRMYAAPDDLPILRVGGTSGGGSE